MTEAYVSTDFLNDLNTIAAEYNGIFNYQNITAPTAQCSTGNCTWPTIPSLGVCGTCTDVTSEIVYTCTSVDNEFSDGGQYNNCTYTITEGHGVDGEAYSFWMTDVSQWTGDHSGELAFAVTHYTSSHYNESKYLYLDTWLIVNATGTSPNAVTCGLWFCVQAYDIKVVNGIQTQQSIGNWSETNYNGTDGLTGGWINFTNVPADMQRGDDYAVLNEVLYAFDQNPIFAGANVTYGLDTYEYAYSSDIVRSLMSVTNYHSWIDLFALGMANNVRAWSGISTPAHVYAGQAFTSVTYVHVRWPWLAFPAAMVTASIAFLVACIWQTKRLRVQAYKSDALALLLATLDVGDEHMLLEKRKIERRRVELRSGEGDVRLQRPANAS